MPIALSRPEPQRGGDRRPPRVLVVEDDPGSRWTLAALLRRVGFECREAADGHEALEMVPAFGPDVILMDLMMPVLDGLAATRHLKADAATRAIAVLALTGYVTTAGEVAARRAGCDDFVPKPVVFPDLMERLKRHLGEP